MEPTSEELSSFEQWRSYLMALARVHIDGRLQTKIDASDVVQQTMLDAHRGRNQFRGENGNEERAWLRRIMARNLADEVRKFSRGKRDTRFEQSLQAASTKSSDRLERDLDGGATSPHRRAMHNERLLSLSRALAALPDAQRVAITLRYLQGRTSVEIANELGRTEIAVAGLLRRGLKRLRQLMPEDQEE